MMQTAIVKWGNSQGIRIPKAVLESIKLKENDPVDVILEDERIIIERVRKKKHKSTKERLEEFYARAGGKEYFNQKEIDWGKPLGEEIW